ncbi:hypothetical protein LY78DRAFT_725597 [Colletotrichum sublineola]|nr:hypothetical protein LY78DRAFT_725597 [Colletotrichum sublineola]
MMWHQFCFCVFVGFFSIPSVLGNKNGTALQHRRLWDFYLPSGDTGGYFFFCSKPPCQLSHPASGTPQTFDHTTPGDGTISPADPFQTVGEPFTASWSGSNA